MLKVPAVVWNVQLDRMEYVLVNVLPVQLETFPTVKVQSVVLLVKKEKNILILKPIVFLVV